MSNAGFKQSPPQRVIVHLAILALTLNIVAVLPASGKMYCWRGSCTYGMQPVATAMFKLKHTVA